MLYAFSIVGPETNISFTTEDRNTVIATAATPLVVHGEWSQENAVTKITSVIEKAENDRDRVAKGMPQVDPTKPLEWCQQFFDISVAILHP